MLANNNKREFETYINESIKYLELLRDRDIIVAIDELIGQIHSSIESGGKIIFCGNGGSASDSQHLAAELVGRYKLDRVPLPAIALNTDTSVITAISNDFGYEKIFERQIEALGNSTDLMVAISTSGESKNVVNAIIAAKKKNIYLYHYAYPQLTNYKNIYKDVEKELVYGVIKQESAFDPKAISRVGARGMMQVMPATASKISKKIKLNYSKERLTSDPEYNIKLGSYYLYSLAEEYDSYILALVGYNAGPRRIKRWVKKFGDPRKKNIDAVSWIEKIPIKETRLYVKIVLSNLQVYRQKNQSSKNLSIFSKKD